MPLNCLPLNGIGLLMSQKLSPPASGIRGGGWGPWGPSHLLSFHFSIGSSSPQPEWSRALHLGSLEGLCQVLNSPHAQSLESAVPSHLPGLTEWEGSCLTFPNLAGRCPLALQLTLGPSSRLRVPSPMQRPQVEKTEAAGCLLFVNLDLIPSTGHKDLKPLRE